MKRGSFIYITGCDGTGKSTQAQLLVEQLRSQGMRTRHVWLRFPFFFSAPLLAYARLRGYSWSEEHDDTRYGYWDFHRSWALRHIFPWLQLLDATLAGLWHIYLPLWLGYTVVCERFTLDMLVDQMVAFREIEFHRHLPGHLYLGLLPLTGLITILDLDADMIRERRASLKMDRCLKERLMAFRAIAHDLQYPTISSTLTVNQINNLIHERL